MRYDPNNDQEQDLQPDYLFDESSPADEAAVPELLFPGIDNFLSEIEEAPKNNQESEEAYNEETVPPTVFSDLDSVSTPTLAAVPDDQVLEANAVFQEESLPLSTQEETGMTHTPDSSVFSASDTPTQDVPQQKPTEVYEETVAHDIDADLTSIMAEFSEISSAEPQQPQKKKRTHVKKGRPRRKKGEGLLGIPNMLATVVWCGLTLLIGLTLGRLVWVCAAEVLAFGREDKSVTITVFESDTIDDITEKLARAELIHYPGLFKLYASFAVDDGDIKPGMWDLNTKYDYHALVKMMAPSSSRDVVKVTIPEGYTCRQIFALLEANKVCTVQDMESYAANGELNEYWFLNDVPRGDKYSLEGFLFPDTYEFYQNDTPRNVLQRMLNNFENKFDEDMQWQIQNLNAHLTDLMYRNGYGQDYVSSHLFSVKDVVNVASMIEKETSSAQEGYTIASVIYNRLFCWGNNPAYLNIDATIVYALGGKTDLTAEDLRVDSPYNTYTNIGLTPGPIANPGLASIKAALDPADTNYYFYVLDPAAGSHHFSTTQAEHEAFRASLGG